MSAGIVAGTGDRVTERLVGLIDQSVRASSFLCAASVNARSGRDARPVFVHARLV